MTHPAWQGSFAHMKLGKKRPRLDDRTLSLSKYLDLTALPPTPQTLAVPTVPSWPMYGNDQLGDCTCAAAGHMVQGWTEVAGDPRTPIDTDVETFYWETGRPPSSTGEPGGPTDDGRDELSILNAWRKKGFGGDRITAYVSIKASDTKMVTAGMYLFGGVYTGIGLPLTAQGQTTWDVVGDGETGDSAPYSWGGHAVPYVGFDENEVTLVTWGGLLNATWRFHLAYTDEVYAILSPDWLTGGKSVEGFDVAALNADLKALHRG